MSSTKEKKPAQRFERTLARPMTAAGEPKRPGETVPLTAAQIERLEPEGYFEPEGRKKRGEAS